MRNLELRSNLVGNVIGGCDCFILLFTNSNRYQISVNDKKDLD